MDYPKRLKLPAFLPDATYLTLNPVPMHEVLSELDGVVITTLHAYAKGVTTILQNTPGGIRSLLRIPKNTVLLSDSGGFQVLSLIHNKKLGKLTPQAAEFKYPHTGEKITLTPELSQQIQHMLGTNIRVVLDYPTMGDESKQSLEKSVEITTQWAKRSKKEFLKLIQITPKEFNKTKPTLKQVTPHSYILEFNRPLLTGVVQGGNSPKLREKSAKQLAKIGFDIYGFGGWPLTYNTRTKSVTLNTSILQHFLDIIPAGSIPYAMGLGTPDDVYTLVKMGYLLFDCVIPTRNARHGLLYVTKGTAEPYGTTFDVLHIKTTKYQTDLNPIDPTCNCPVCKNYSRAYIRLLLKTKNPVGYTLAALHNVWWYQRFMEHLREYGTYPKKQQIISNTPTMAKTSTSPSKTNQTPKASGLNNKKSQNIIKVITDAAVKIPNAHLKGHSGTGKATCGFFIQDTKNNTLAIKTAHKLKDMTIPQAEFNCVLIALKKALEIIKKQKLHGGKVVILSDSQLLVKWLNLEYKVKKQEIKDLFNKFQQLQQEFLKHGFVITAKWHRRNSKLAQVADKLANG